MKDEIMLLGERESVKERGIEGTVVEESGATS